jgi:predicted porin
MKKTLVALAALAAFGAQAQSSVQIDGNFNAGYQANSYKGVSLKGFDQNGAGTTQINIRGTEDLGGGMAAYFRVENDLSIMRNDANQGVPTAVGSGTTAASTTVQNNTTQQTNKGLASSWGNGELAVGARSAAYGDFAFGALNNAGLTTTVLTASPLQGTSFGGGYGSIIGADPTLSIVRWGNSFRYITPAFNGLTGQINYARKQTNQANTFGSSGVASTTPNMGVGQLDQIGATELSAKYVNGPLTLGFVNTKTSTVDASFCATLTNTASPFQVAGQNQPCYTTASTTAVKGTTIGNGYEAKQNSFAAKYDLSSALTLSGAYQATTLGGIGASTDQSDRKAWIGTATYVTGAHTMFVTYGTAKENAAANVYNGKKTTMTGLGYNYALSKRTALVARYESLTDDAGIIAPSYVSSTVNLLGTDSSNKRVRSMFGISHNF